MAMDVVEDARIRLAATQEDAAAYKEADPDYFRPYFLRSDWRLTGAGGGLAGLEGFQYADTGGAHGNYFTDGRIYDTLTGDQLRLKDLFEDPAAANAALEGPVFRALETEKALRTGDTSNLDMLLGEAKDAIGGDILGVDASLVASVEAGKIGGLALHFAPYDIGSYAEGAYHVTIPQEAFAALLKPHYAGAFGGEPAPLKRPDDPV